MNDIFRGELLANIGSQGFMDIIEVLEDIENEKDILMKEFKNRILIVYLDSILKEIGL